MNIYLTYGELGKILSRGFTMNGEEVDASTGLEYIPRTIRLFRVVDEKLWMLTVLKTGIIYSNIESSTMEDIRKKYKNILKNQ